MDCPNPKRSVMEYGLPEDSLVEILSRATVRTVYSSKCVAKGWRDLVEDPLHRNKIPQTLKGFFSIDKKGVPNGSDGAAHVGFTSLLARSSASLGIDCHLSFPMKLCRTQILTLADSCNGLLLFEYGLSSLCVVCNPATKHWVSVPRSKNPRRKTSYIFIDSLEPIGQRSYTYLVFDPVVSPHFHIVQFWFQFKKVLDWLELEMDWPEEVTKEVYRISVDVYSSETGKWSHILSDWEEELGQLEGWRHQGFVPRRVRGCAVLNGVLHFIISDQQGDHDQIVAVDVQGQTQRFIPLPTMALRKPGYVAQSQGHLHYIGQAFFALALLSIWVLEDTQKWVLKHSVSFVELFGQRMHSVCNTQYRVVAMHPDGNVVFIVQNQKLISYDIDHKITNVIATLADNISAKHIVPYVPCYLELPALIKNRTECALSIGRQQLGY